MVAFPTPSPLFHVTDPTNGNPLALGKVYTYATGTTTPKLTWADKDKVAANTNPVILDANGDAPIFLDGTYKFIVHRADDTLVYEIDGVSTSGSGGASGGLSGEEEIVTSATRTIVPADEGKTFIANRAGGVTFNFSTAALLGEAFMIMVKNIGAGDLVLDPNSSETIDGVSTVSLSMGRSGLVTSNGTALRTILSDRALPTFNVKDFGAIGDGVVNDTAAILLGETARAAVGGDLVFPPGDYLTNGTAINRANGGAWRGIGSARLIASANGTIICNLSGAVIGANARPFRVTGLFFDGNGFTSVRAVNENGPHFTQFDHCTIKQVQFAGAFVGANVASQHGWIQIHDIIQYGAGSWAFYGYDDTKYLFHIEINNIHQQGTGAANWESQFWFEGRRAVGLSMTNVWSGSLDGDADGLLLRGDCQGVFLANCTFVWPICGIRALTWTDTLKPAYVYMANVGVDQHTESAADIEGRTWFITNSNFANGYVRNNTGSGMVLQSNCTDIAISNTLFAYDENTGLKIETGATKIRLNGITAENNNQSAGAFYDVDLQASAYTDVVLYGRNIIGTAGVNATGQRVVDGVTSKEVSRNTGAVSTTAVTTAEDLMSYTIPANVTKSGQLVRVKAWGTTAANANTKTGRLWFGSTNMGGWSGALNNVGWTIEADVYITGASAQEYVRKSLTSSIQVTTATMTEAGTSTIVAKFQGQNGTASAGDITCQGLTVEIID